MVPFIVLLSIRNMLAVSCALCGAAQGSVVCGQEFIPEWIPAIPLDSEKIDSRPSQLYASPQKR